MTGAATMDSRRRRASRQRIVGIFIAATTNYLFLPLSLSLSLFLSRRHPINRRPTRRHFRYYERIASTLGCMILRG